MAYLEFSFVQGLGNFTMPTCVFVSWGTFICWALWLRQFPVLHRSPDCCHAYTNTTYYAEEMASTFISFSIEEVSNFHLFSTCNSKSNQWFLHFQSKDTSPGDPLRWLPMVYGRWYLVQQIQTTFCAHKKIRSKDMQYIVNLELLTVFDWNVIAISHDSATYYVCPHFG